MEPINVDTPKTEQKFNNTEKIIADAGNGSDRKLLWLRFAYVILFIIAFVALLNVWLSFLAVPKIVSWIVFGICFSGGSICMFFACRIKNLKNQEKKQINLVYPITQNNGYTMIYSDVEHVNSNINHDFYSDDYSKFGN
ncbi:MAG: hypothetical protein IJU86_04325 [Firmicutes bacterium]|nr:hypothetical protein [Bacillota bacterium]